MILLLVQQAMAQSERLSETIVEVRHDLYGERMIAGWQVVSIAEHHHGASIHAMAALDALSGVDERLDPDLYLLSARIPWRGTRWTVGRQRAVGALRPVTLDGARVEVVFPHATLEAWGGIARHQDLDDLADGTTIGRMRGTFGGRRWNLALGGELQSEVALLPRADAEARVHLGKTRWTGGAVAGWDESVILEHGRFGVAARLGRLDAELHGAHREATLPGNLLDDRILASFAPDGTDEVGVGGRWINSGWSSMSARYALQTYLLLDERLWGHAVDLGWDPGPTTTLQFLPAFRFRASPGGILYAFWLVSRAPLGRFDVEARGAVVPFRAGRSTWDVAAHLGADLGRSFGPIRITTGFDSASDAHYHLDLRGHMVVRLEAP